jgi:hypothetical protein
MFSLIFILLLSDLTGHAIAQAVSCWLPTVAVWGSKPDLGMWDLWWDKVALGRFSPSTSVSPAIVIRSTNYSTVTLIYHPGKMYNRPMCGRSTGTYTNLEDLQRHLRGLSPTPSNKKKIKKYMDTMHPSPENLYMLRNTR